MSWRPASRSRFVLQDGRLVEQELLAQQSLLRSSEPPLAVSVAIPDVVLTGSRYDIDLIVEEAPGLWPWWRAV